MSAGIRKQFYRSKLWQRTADAYRKSKHGLCERCLANGLIVPGVIVHHKHYLTDANLSDESIALSFDNLELLCRQCHADEHAGENRRKKQAQRRWKLQEDGTLDIIDRDSTAKTSAE